MWAHSQLIWARIFIVAINVGRNGFIFAVNLGQENAMIAGRGVYDCEPLHLILKKKILKKKCMDIQMLVSCTYNK